jgi:hypothetical protein
MGFNFGGFAGGLSNGMQQGLKLAQAYKQQRDQQDLQDTLKAMPQVGSDNVDAGAQDYAGQDGTKYAPDQVGKTAIRQGSVTPEFKKFTQADQDAYVNRAILSSGNPELAAKYGLQRSQGNYYGAEATGKGIANDQTLQLQQRVTDATKNFNGLTTQIAGGDLQGGQQGIMQLAAQNGIKFEAGQNGQLSYQGHPIDLTSRDGQLAVLGQLHGLALSNAFASSGTVAGAQAGAQLQHAGAATTQAGAAATNAATEASKAPSQIALARAQATNQYAEASTAPARANALNGQANYSNAGANHTTAMLPYDQGESAAKTGSYTADADYKSAETTGLGYTNGALKNVSELKPEDFEPDANGVVKADGVVKQAAALKNAPSVYSADKSTDRNTDTITSRENISQANIQSKEKIAQWGNATKEDTAKIRAAGKGAGLAGENWVEDKNAFGQWHDTKSGAIMKMDPKNPNKPIIIKKPDAVGGIQTRMVRDNKTGTLSAAYVGKDGLYDNAAEAASSFGRSGVVPTKENPFGAGQTAALPNLPTR